LENRSSRLNGTKIWLTTLSAIESALHFREFYTARASASEAPFLKSFCTSCHRKCVILDATPLSCHAWYSSASAFVRSQKDAKRKSFLFASA